MQHFTLFLYFLFLSSGFAGITVVSILGRRTGSRLLRWILLLLGIFTLWLFVATVLYYIEEVLGFPYPLSGILGAVNFILGTAAYIVLFICLLKSPFTVRLPSLIPAVTPVALYYLYLALGASLFPGLIRFATERVPAFSLFSIAAGAVFIGYAGYGFTRAAAAAERFWHGRDESIVFLLRWFGRVMLVFAAVSAAAGTGLLLTRTSSQLIVLLEFGMFFFLNVVAIIALIRYLSRPAALLENGKIGEGFLKEYAVSAREAEIIELISHGMSNKEIASSLNLSPATVRTHIYNIFKKTGAASRVELLRIVSGYRQ